MYREKQSKKGNHLQYIQFMYIFIYLYIFIAKLLLCFLNRDALFLLSPINLQIIAEEEAFGTQTSCFPSLHVTWHEGRVGWGEQLKRLQVCSKWGTKWGARLSWREPPHARGREPPHARGHCCVPPPQITATPGCAPTSPDSKGKC